MKKITLFIFIGFLLGLTFSIFAFENPTQSPPLGGGALQIQSNQLLITKSTKVTPGNNFIVENGNVGIGTTAPGAKLDVVGNIQNIGAPPIRVGTVTLADGEDYSYSIAVSGRYAYVTTDTSPAKVVVVDISNPSSPTRVGTVTLGRGEDSGSSIAVSGRYAYVTTLTSPAKVVVVDIGGIETTSMMAHALEAGTLQVRQDLTVYNHLRVGGGLNVGPGGIFSAGPIVSASTVSGNSALDIRNSAGAPLLFVHSNGNVGIGTMTPGHRLAVSGNVGAGGFYNDSDIALKKNIKNLKYGLNEIMSLQPREFDLKADNSHNIGFIAQEIEKIIPEIVSGEEGRKGIAYDKLTPVLVKAIQELKAEKDKEINELKRRIEILENKF